MSSYEPTTSERELSRRVTDDFIMSGDGMFATLQGEGITAGAPSVFMRLQNCNLSCGKDDKGWKCDAWYTWDKSTPEYWKEASTRSVDEVTVAMDSLWQQTFGDEDPAISRRLVITGGEPLLQQPKIVSLLDRIPGWSVEIETNGTITPRAELDSCQINCSPKLATSGNKLQARRRIKALTRINAMPSHVFKFVIADVESDTAEVIDLMYMINGGDFSDVLLMAEGTVATDLTKSETLLKSIARDLGARFTARNHIYWYGDKRAT